MNNIKTLSKKAQAVKDIIDEYENTYNYIVFSAPTIETELNADGVEKKKLNMPTGWQNTEFKTKNYSYDHQAFFILTGKKSNLTVLDFDDATEYNRLVIKFPKLLEYYTIKTRRGYHIYFLYCDKLESGTDCFSNYKNIDVLNNKKCVIAPPTTFKLLDGSKIKYREVESEGEIYTTEIPNFLLDELILNVPKPQTTTTAPKIKSKYNHTNAEKIDIINKCFQCLKSFRCDTYSEWFNINIIIKNELGVEGFEVIDDWSRQGGNNYNKTSNQKLYNDIIIKEDGLSIGTLRKIAKDDNEEQYNILFPKALSNFNILEKMNTTDLAVYFKLLYSDKFIYYNEKLYNFNGTYWKAEDKKNLITINNFIGNEFFNKMIEYIEKEEKKIFTNMTEQNGPQFQQIMDKIQKFRSSIYELKNYDKRAKIINEILCHLHNDEIRFDNNPYLFAFENKIYDLRINEFIEPKADQYISITTGYKFDESYKSKDKIKELNKLLDSIFPQPEIKNLYLTILSTGLDGIPLEKFVLANGGGGNGKGLINEFVQYMLGNYAYILPVNILLGPLKQGSNPEIANMNNKRLVIAREPDKNLMFNCATIKEICGGSEINARVNYSNDTKVNLRLTFLLECNEKPKLNEVNDALSRRILDIPFKNKFVDKQQYDELDEDDKKTTFLINSKYKTTEFKEDYKQALFLILVGHYKTFHDNERVLPIPAEIIKRNKEYLAKSDEFLSWFEDNYEKTTNKKDIIKLKAIYELFKGSEYFSNLSKLKKRENNYSNFCDSMGSNMFLKKYITENKDRVKIITNYKAKENNNDEDSDDENPLDN